MTTYYNYLGQAMPVGVAPTNNIYGGNADGTTYTAPQGASSVNPGGGANDVIIGANGDQTYYLNVPSDTVQLAPGLTGIKNIVTWQYGVLPAGATNLTFQGAQNWGVGNAGNNLIIMAGNDANYMDGGGGNDVLVGGFGQNNFGVTANTGSDVIYNFHTNQDTVRLPGTSFTTPAQVLAAMTQVGPDVVLKLDANDTLTFRGVQIADFQAKNFLLPLDASKLGALTLDDEFNGPQFYNASTGQGIWKTNLGGDPTKVDTYAIMSNQEKQAYTDPSFQGATDHPLGYNPFSFSNGVLSITAQRFTGDAAQEAFGQAYSSGMLSSQGAFMQQYGYFEMKAELPQGAGTWPAFWLVQDPYKPGVEADVLEHLGMYPNVDFARSNDAGVVTGNSYYNTSPSGFHTYGMLWTPTETTFYVDERAVMQMATPASWDKPMYLILNLAIGGWGGPIDDSALPATMQIDYVRVYGLADNSQVVENAAQIAAAAASSSGGGDTTPTGSGAVGPSGGGTTTSSGGGDTTASGGGTTAPSTGATVSSGGMTSVTANGVTTDIFTGSLAQYSVTNANGQITVTDSLSGRDGSNTLTNVQQLQFSDYTLVFDRHTAPDQLVYELYQAAFARIPDNAGFRYWATVVDTTGMSPLYLADQFLAAPEFTQKYGASPTTSQYVTELYANVLGRAPDQAGLDYWIGQANAGQPRDQLLVDFAVSPENVQLIGAHISNGYWTTH